MKKAAAVAVVTAVAAFLIRVLFHLVSIDPLTGFGSIVSRASLYILILTAIIEFAVYPAKKLIWFLRPGIGIRSAPSSGRTVFGFLAGLLTSLTSALAIAEVVSEGNMAYFFAPRSEALNAGILDASFQWRFIAGVLGIPAGIWLILAARREYGRDAVLPGGRLCAALPVLYAIFRVLARYTHDGGNPHNETAAACLASTAFICILTARFATFVVSGCSGSSAIYLCRYMIPALICSAAALPAALPMAFNGEYVHAGYVVADVAFAIFCLINTLSLKADRTVLSDPECTNEVPERE